MKKYENLILFLDNDTAGIKAAEYLCQNFNVKENQSKIIYPNYKDFNDFIIQKNSDIQ